jgi:myo-inositol catabolism protein IolS
MLWTSRHRIGAQEVEMESRQCGRSALRLSALGIGCWSFGGGAYWGECPQEDADTVVRRAVDLGITYFDTAEAYNDGRSETSLGQALRGVPRNQVLVGSKVSPSHCYAATLPRHCEASLRRLGLDYLDLYMIHWPIHPHSIRHFTAEEAVIASPPTVEEAFAALEALRRQGKVRYIGVSNFGASRLDEALRLCPDLAVNQLPHSLLTRAIEREALPRCRRLGVGVIGYMTLLQGVLSDRYPDLTAVPPHQRRTRHFSAAASPLARHGEAGAERETGAALAAIRAIAAECGMSTAEIATKWALAVPGITCCLVGVRSLRRLDDNVRAAAEPLPPGVFERLNAASQPLLEKLGDSFDYYESVENNRTR